MPVWAARCNTVSQPVSAASEQSASRTSPATTSTLVPHAGLDRLQPAFPAARDIEDHGAHLVSGPDQAFDQVGADQAVGAGDQRLHDRPASSMARPLSMSIRGKRRWLLFGQQL